MNGIEKFADTFSYNKEFKENGYINKGTFVKGATQTNWINSKYSDLLWDHSFSTYARFSEKLTFLTLIRTEYVCVSGGKKCWFFGKVCVRYK